MKKKNIILLCIVTIIITFSINVYADECSGIFDSQFISDLDTFVYKPVKWATPVLLLVLTSIDFAKVVFANDGKAMDKAKNNFLKRAVAALIIFFAPDVIKLLVSFVNDQSIASCLQNNFK